MVAKKLTFLFLATLILSNVGCSSGRLRNMVGRSEYSSLDELDAQDSAAPLGAQDESFVSQSREVDSTDPEVTQERRKGFFDFAKVFNRKSHDDEFAPDPFSEAVKPTEVKTVSMQAEAESVVKQEVDTKADQFSSTISAVEKQSETLFEESLAKSASEFFETEPTTDVVQTTTNESAEDSFASFARERSVAGAVVADVKEKAAAALDTVRSTRAVQTAKAVANDFDALLNSAAGGIEKTVAAAAPSALFPGLSEEFDAAFGDLADPVEPSETEIVDVFAPAADIAVAASTFEETAQKHGFGIAESKDPWAAFGRDRTVVALPRPEPSAVTETQTVAARNDFVWGRAIESESASVEEPAFTFSDTQPERLHETPDQAFLQVSSARPLETQAPVDVSGSMPLMIPGGPSTSEPSLIHSDPFLTAVPAFDEVADFSAESEVAAAVPTVATADGGVSQWSRRTWFLLIGCLIVALLLFMPDRHNRTNA